MIIKKSPAATLEVIRHSVSFLVIPINYLDLDHVIVITILPVIYSSKYTEAYEAIRININLINYIKIKI